MLLFGKTLLATREIHRQFRQRTVGKTYLAVAAGVPARTAFTVDAAIGRHTTDKCGVCWTRWMVISNCSDASMRAAYSSRAWLAQNQQCIPAGLFRAAHVSEVFLRTPRSHDSAGCAAHCSATGSWA